MTLIEIVKDLIHAIDMDTPLGSYLEGELVRLHMECEDLEAEEDNDGI